MNKQKFVEYIRKPASLETPQLEELSKAISEFPYFQSARMLLAKAGKKTGHKSANRWVSSAAIYVTDRKLLKRYLNDELIFLNPLKVHESHEAERNVEIKSAIDSTRKVSVQNKIKNSPIPKYYEPTKPPSKPRTLDDIPESIQEPVSPAEKTNLDELIEDLYRDMEALKVSKARLLEVEKKLEEEDAVNEALNKAHKKKRVETTETETPVKAEQVEDQKSEPAPKNTKIKSKKADSADQPATKKPFPAKKAEHEAIIENFIKVNPTISKFEAGKKIVMDLAGDSIELNPEVASEYLAEIYLEQGKKERAIQIYMTLIEKIPEKSAYFADIIEKLKSES